MRKGITPVISIVLLLLIVVAIIGIAFGWFVGIFDTVTGEGDDVIEGTVDRFGQISSIDSAICVDGVDPVEDTITLYVKATDKQLAKGDVSIYLDGALIGSNTAIIGAGDTDTLTFANGDEMDGVAGADTITVVCPSAGNSIKISTTDPAGVGDEFTIEA